MQNNSSHLNSLLAEFSQYLNRKRLLCFRSSQSSHTKLQRIHHYCEKHGFVFKSSTIKMIQKSFTNLITSAFEYGFEANNEQADIKLQLTHVHALPSRTEEGIFIIIEVGNPSEDVRYSLVLLLGKQIPSYEILHSVGYNLADAVRQSSGTLLLEQLAVGLKNFLEHSPFNENLSRSFPLGLLLHFPLRQTELNHAEILSWSDRFDCPDLLHHDFIALFHRTIEQCLAEYHIQIVACLTDSVAALISVAYEYPNTFLSLIFKQTFQLSFVENTEMLRSKNLIRALYRTILTFDLQSLHSPQSKQSHALFQTLLTSIDTRVMQQLHGNYFDVFTCDYFLLEIIRLLIVDLCLHEQLLPSSLLSQSKLTCTGSLSSPFLSYLLQGKYSRLKPYLIDLGLKEISKVDLICMKYVSHLLVRRSTQVLSCLIVCLSDRYNEENITIAMDSYLYRRCPVYQMYMYTEIESLCKRWVTMFHFVNAINKSYLGPAAVMGLQKTQKALMNQDDNISRLYRRKKKRQHTHSTKKSHL